MVADATLPAFLPAVACSVAHYLPGDARTMVVIPHPSGGNVGTVFRYGGGGVTVFHCPCATVVWWVVRGVSLQRLFVLLVSFWWMWCSVGSVWMVVRFRLFACQFLPFYTPDATCATCFPHHKAHGARAVVTRPDRWVHYPAYPFYRTPRRLFPR